MSSNQNPIHRDRDKRGKGAEPYQDAKEALNEKQAEIDRQASVPGDQGDGLTDEQRSDLQKQAASERLADVQDEVEDKKDN